MPTVSMPTVSDAIPTNIITGFLGVGKTTAILHLLRNKPSDETWSVLVNEFGEIGIDGRVLNSVNAHVREVPGGCICCAAAVPMKVVLNRMITATKPHRILIEPTGLGHPEEIIRTLTTDYYAHALDLRATVTLVDPRKAQDQRYRSNEIFRDQLRMADVLVANKMDVASSVDKAALQHLLSELSISDKNLYWVSQGKVMAHWLDQPRLQKIVHTPSAATGLLAQRQVPGIIWGVDLQAGEDFVRRPNQGQGYFSCGWLFRADWLFDFNQLFLFMTGLAFLRAKAVINTTQGAYVFNSENGVLSVNQWDSEVMPELNDSRVEFIDDQIIVEDAIEQQLLAMVQNRS